MSSNAFGAPLRLELLPSRRLRQWRLLVHCAGVLTLPLLQSPLLGACVLVLLLVSFFRRPFLPSTLLWRSDGQWQYRIGGPLEPAELAATAMVQPWLVILPLRCQGRRRIRHLVILPDMLPAQDFRRLRARLRIALTDAAAGNGADSGLR